MIDFARYLGRPFTDLRAHREISSWQYVLDDEELGGDPGDRSYIFSSHGLEVECDSDDRISVVFLHAKTQGGFDQSLISFDFSASQATVRAKFGAPSRTGVANNYPGLGQLGAWDRYDFDDRCLHFQYATSGEGISMITIMRPGRAP